MTEAAARDDVDRLSTLPEDILLNILSSLDTREAVQSSILSKTYRHLWTSVPDLSFHSSDFKTVDSFPRFIDEVLSRRNNSINIKNFSFVSDFIHNNWSAREKILLERATNPTKSAHHRRFKILLDDPPNEFRMDNCFLACLLSKSSSMESLKLESLFDLYDSRCFHQLISLELTSVSLVVFDPFSCCPNLENVTLTRCNLKTVILSNYHRIALKVSAARLSRLSILNCLSCEKENIVLKTPRLRFFECESEKPLLLEADELLDLQFASIRLSGWSYCLDYPYGKKREFGLDVINILHCVRNAKSVTLSVSIAELLSVIPEILEQEHSPLRNLKLLKFFGHAKDKAFYEIPGDVLEYLLKNSPYAETVNEFSPGKLQCTSMFIGVGNYCKLCRASRAFFFRVYTKKFHKPFPLAP